MVWAGYWSPAAVWCLGVVRVSSSGWNRGVLMAPKLASCDVFGMLLKYWLSTLGGCGAVEKPIVSGVLVISSIGLLSLLLSVSDGNMTCCLDEFAVCDS